MKIITLSENQFTEYANKHKYRNIYQTVSYAKLMKTDGYDYHLLGFLNNSNELIGATMLLYKRIFYNYKVAYAPFGFLVDYSNNDLIEELTEKLKLLLYKQKFLYLKISPKVECSKRDKNGIIKAYNPEINDIMEILQKNNYIHTGFNNYFENLKPRWNAILNLTASNQNLEKDLNKTVRNKINKAKRCGIEIYEANNDDIQTFFEFIKRKHTRNLKYYQKLLKEYGNDAKIYLAVLNPRKYLEQSKAYYETELSRNEQLNSKLAEINRYTQNIDKIISQKMESDRVVANCQKHLVDATNLYSKNHNPIIVGGMLTVEYLDDVYLIIEGFDNKYSDFDPNYLLKWKLIEKWNQDGKKSFNMNGIVGEFREPNQYSGLNESKLGYNADAVEYIGEFDLIINKAIYNIYTRRRDKKKNN